MRSSGLRVQVPERRFLQYSVLAPLLVPFLFAPFYSATEATVGTVIFGILMVSLAFGGIPYLVFAMGLLWWGRGRRVPKLIRAAWFAPLLFAPLAAMSLATYMAFTSPVGSRLETAVLFGIMSLLYGVLVGYGYALTVLAAWAILRSQGCLQPEQA